MKRCKLGNFSYSFKDGMSIKAERSVGSWLVGRSQWQNWKLRNYKPFIYTISLGSHCMWHFY